jgi:hypothetical protein
MDLDATLHAWAADYFALPSERVATVDVVFNPIGLRVTEPNGDLHVHVAADDTPVTVMLATILLAYQ